MSANLTVIAMVHSLPAGIDLGDERAVIVALTSQWRANEIYAHLDRVIEHARSIQQRRAA